MNRNLLAVLISLMVGMLACGIGPAATADPNLPDISGIYDLQGTNFDGSTYQGEVELTRQQGNEYSLIWTIGEQQQTGTGTFDGTTLDVVWQQGSEGSGTATYVLQPDGTLIGTWAIDGVEGQGGETSSPARLRRL